MISWKTMSVRGTGRLNSVGRVVTSSLVIGLGSYTSCARPTPAESASAQPTVINASPSWVPNPPAIANEPPDASASDEKRGHLVPQQIAEAVMARIAEFRGCYESIVGTEGVRGYASIEWEIQPDGTVRDARRQARPDASSRPDDEPSEEFQDPRILDCFIRVMRRIRFPAAARATNAGWTFNFRPTLRADAGRD
jgi:hypothetical protein